MKNSVILAGVVSISLTLYWLSQNWINNQAYSSIHILVQKSCFFCWSKLGHISESTQPAAFWADSNYQVLQQCSNCWNRFSPNTKLRKHWNRCTVNLELYLGSICSQMWGHRVLGPNQWTWLLLLTPDCLRWNL